MSIEFKRLTEVSKSALIELMNHSQVREHMPLAIGPFGESECEQFVADKERLWEEHGYGPWAFVVDGEFVGWGGLQPENGEADLALVLHPDHWGLGMALYREIIDQAFGEIGLETITALLPPTRKKPGALLRLGFIKDGELSLGNQRFIRYRLHKPAAPS